MNSRHNFSRPMDKKPLLLLLLYTALLVYASLMPFDFSLDQDFAYQIHLFFSAWPFNIHARVSGSDVASNLFLYLPLGGLTALTCQIAGLPRKKTLVISVLVCSLTSLTVEITQIFLISRIASASDWLINSISGFIGATGGVVCCKELWFIFNDYLRQLWHRRPLNILTIIFMSLLAADAWAPFLPTIRLSQVWRNLKRSHFDIFAGLALHSLALVAGNQNYGLCHLNNPAGLLARPEAANPTMT